MGSKSGKVISTAFPAGASVSLYPRVSDDPESDSAGKEEAKAKVDKNSEVTFSSLEPGTPYWLVYTDDDGNVTSAAVQAKDPEEPDKAPESTTSLSMKEVREQLQEAAAEGGNMEPVIEGARTTVKANPKVKRDEFGDQEIERVDDPSSPPFDAREPGSKSARGLSDMGTSPVKDEEDRTPAYHEDTNPPPETPIEDPNNPLPEGAADEGESSVPDGFIEDADLGQRPADRDPDEVPSDPLEGVEDDGEPPWSEDKEGTEVEPPAKSGEQKTTTKKAAAKK